jgi:hypothetical protein
MTQLQAVASEPAVLGLLRETLERELDAAAAPLLFDALGAFGPRVPSTFAEVVDLVQGPLRVRLVARFGVERAAALVHDLERALRLAEMPTQELSRVQARPFDAQTTRSFPAVSGALDVLVVAGRETLITRLGPSFAPSQMHFLPARTAGDLARLDPSLAVALIDATDLPKASPRVLAASLKDASVILLWGSETAAANDVLEALRREQIPLMTFRSDESIDPLLDVLRSRLAR